MGTEFLCIPGSDVEAPWGVKGVGGMGELGWGSNIISSYMRPEVASGRAER